MSFDCCKQITLDKKNNKIKVCVASNNWRPLDYKTYEICNSDNKYYKDYTFDDKLLNLYYDLESGNIQVTYMNNNTEKFEYALCKVREYLREHNIDSYEELYCKRRSVYEDILYKEIGLQVTEDERENDLKYIEWRKKQDENYINALEEKCRKKALREVYGETFEIFKKALYEKIEGEYKIIFNRNYVVTKIGKFDRGYSSFKYSSKDMYDFENDKMKESNNFATMSYKKAYVFCKYLGRGRDLEIVKV